jgi:hypothetical protein
MNRRWQFLNRYIPTRLAAFVFLLIGVLIVGAGYAVTQGALNWHTLIDEIYSNLGIEFVSIAITVLVVDRLNQRQSTIERRTDLILQMGSPDNAFAIEAVRLLRQKGWLTDGSLRGANLAKANLAHADLSNADLRGVNLVEAHLEEALLNNADLREASLGFAQLQDANLSHANLEHTRLGGANLAGANLSHTNLAHGEAFSANLHGAHMHNANLQETRLRGAAFNEKTVLPCGNSWTEDTNLRKYTQPKEWALEQAQ